MLEELKVLLLVAVRNLALHKIKTFVVGGILLVGSFLVVFGLSLLGSIENTMSQSIIGSVAGHLQVYSANARDELALFGSGFFGRDDLGEIEKFEDVKAELLKHPNVADVVPLGFENAFLARGNLLDDLFERFRATVKAGVEADTLAMVETIKTNLRTVRADLENELKISSIPDEVRKQISDVEQALSDEFWSKLKTDPESLILFLESKIAPLSGEKEPLYLRYMGTNPEQFTEVFRKFKIVTGQNIPPGERGILLSQRIYETQIKNIVARGFDNLRKGTVEQRKKIADDVSLRTISSDLPKQYLETLVYLNGEQRKEITSRLKSFLKSEENDIETLMKQFLTVDDSNFSTRFEFFYKTIAPQIQLYPFEVGDTINLRSYTRSGFLKTVPLKIYGTYQFSGLESSDLAGAFNFVDMVSYRELYGRMSSEGQKELEALRKEVDLKPVAGESLEDALFGGDAALESRSSDTATAAGAATASAPEAAPVIEFKRVQTGSYNPNELNTGMVINAAILLKNPRLLGTTRAELEQRLGEAKMQLKVVDWKQASGTLGQLVTVIRAVLLIAVGIILVVAMAIINNAIMMTTLERTREIGTLRAIGAQRNFILRMFFVETLTIAVLATFLGSLLAAALVGFLGARGIASPSDFVSFLFGGPRLYPTLSPTVALVAPCVVALLALIFTLYPAFMASRITPAAAMQDRE
jgi:ABC-type lipoprotein release transport system permease subunit